MTYEEALTYLQTLGNTAKSLCDAVTAIQAPVRTVKEDGCSAKRFIDNTFGTTTDGTITDTQTGLMWQRDVSMARYTWDQALAYVHSLRLAGRSDWRLPTVQELVNIIDYTRCNPAIDPIFSPTVAGYYWSATTHATYPSDAWVVDFFNGDVFFDNKDNTYYVRAVRAGSY